MQKRKVNWSPQAQKQYHSAFRYILKDSFQNAEQLQRKLTAKLEVVSVNPEICPPDKYKRNNSNGHCRVFTIMGYRVSYGIKGDEIRVLRIRHTKMRTKHY